MKKLFKVTFLNGPGDQVEVYARSVEASDIIGLIELKDIVFVDSSEIILNPEDDRIKKIFRDVIRTMVPIGSIIRVDEVTIRKNTSVVQLYKGNDETDN